MSGMNRREIAAASLDRAIDLLRANQVEAALAQINALAVLGMFLDVRDFHLKFGVPAPLEPTLPTDEILALRRSLHKEEAREVDEALEKKDLVAIVHECLDNIVINLGTLVSCGVNPVGPWNELHAANMRKERNPNGGKILKPAGWVPADIKSTIDRQIKHAKAMENAVNEPNSQGPQGTRVRVLEPQAGEPGREGAQSLGEEADAPVGTASGAA